MLEDKNSILRKRIQVRNTWNVIAKETNCCILEVGGFGIWLSYQDVSKEEKAREQHMNLKMETIDIAQKVIDKQMMVAQEIAGHAGRDYSRDQSDAF